MNTQAMNTPDQKVFPFAEFDPILRRDLCSVLEKVMRELGISEGNSSNTAAYAEGDVNLKACAIARLRALAESGERSADRLFEETIRSVTKAASAV